MGAEDIPSHTTKPAHVVDVIDSKFSFIGCEVKFLVDLNIFTYVTGLLDVHVCFSDVSLLIGKGDTKMDNPVDPGEPVTTQLEFR